jgi:endonuclease/exonuclease/phosphatase family metal-dependent hydrolase
MKIVSLNTWLGKLQNEILNFIKREAPSTDIFCFQEMTSAFGDGNDMFSTCARALPSFQGFFEASQDLGEGVEMGLALFVKRTDPFEKEGDFFVYRTRNAMVNNDARTMGRNVQYIQFPHNGKEFTVVNFHGLWSGKDRLDNPDRIAQSEKIKTFLQTLAGSRVVCGDFNLTIDTKSLAIIDQGMKNLIREYGITSTRPEQHFPYPDKYADYVLTDRDVEVKDFCVLPDVVSDHLPLVVEFE